MTADSSDPERKNSQKLDACYGGIIPGRPGERGALEQRVQALKQKFSTVPCK